MDWSLRIVYTAMQRTSATLPIRRAVVLQQLAAANCGVRTDEDSVGHLLGVYERMIDPQMPHRPLDICSIFGDRLAGGTGESFDLLSTSRLVYLRCKDWATQGSLRVFSKLHSAQEGSGEGKHDDGRPGQYH